MRIGAVVLPLTLLALVMMTAACGGGLLGQQYEYEEEMYLSLDGSATIYVNSSIPALNALRGTTFDVRPNVEVDRDAVRAFFTSPVTRVVGSITSSRRLGRRFAHVRIEVDDVRRLHEAPPFAWSSYAFGQKGAVFVFDQKVGGAPGAAVESNWTGDELVAFRVHIPSKVAYHNAGGDNLKRGNILVWEQTLADRLRGAPLEIDARMETQSILYRTLWLFAGTIVAVALMFVAIVWFIVRRGGRAVPHRGAA
jgi:hypothetical protein